MNYLFLSSLTGFGTDFLGFSVIRFRTCHYPCPLGRWGLIGWKGLWANWAGITHRCISFGDNNGSESSRGKVCDTFDVLFSEVLLSCSTNTNKIQGRMSSLRTCIIITQVSKQKRNLSDETRCSYLQECFP